ncbi:hypothetical protein TUM19329_31470 [Legionella antarctica]|uniref:Defect in organelle trafficking protein DotA n=1 Tax=Legionella antarctica TaxID=2708020 RepID=A0A6F8T9X6_9GAMM|nr:type IVB secretion system protein DotA [Legionella antarctica]BCA96786.1 hypothetical protein TUM19329_31470 [Legionella antarctica]
MNKVVVAVLLSFFPALVLADSTLSFAPPASDYSIVFLGNLFGIVDGVLHGTGSQIMGTMFAVFNSAVLAVGGVIIMYTLMVSTMNTAHEGQMLGQKWSSIWIPVRSTLGLALLIPKASGYCLMQIFVMWIVVQGIGAADKVWEAALGYLNRGGVIIQAQQSNPTRGLINPQSSGVPGGAMSILAGQVCMLGLQKQLEAQRQTYLEMSQNSTSTSAPCNSDALKDFCNAAIPDFITTVNVVAVQNDKMNSNKNIIPKDYEAPMPNFTKSSTFNFLNGICGTIKWKSIAGLGTSGTMGVTDSQFKTAQMSRAIAIQQMYVDLTAVAQVMVNNNPAITPSTGSNSPGSDASKNYYSLIAREQFGVPLTASGTVCGTYTDKCVIWGPIASGSGVLFNGTEFQGAISDYNGIMTPTLNLMSIANDFQNKNNTRAFINEATNKGWIMAGSYFFDLVALNGNAADTTAATDTGTGLDSSTFGFNGIASGTCNADSYALLCTWFGNSAALLVQVQALIDGTYVSAGAGGVPIPGTAAKKPKLDSSSIAASTVDKTLTSSSVYGFVNNSMMMQVQGQPGLEPLQFANMIHFSVEPQTYYLQQQNFDCGKVKIAFFSFCLGRMMGNLFYNAIFRYIYNAFLAMFSQIINQVIMAFLMIPLQGMATIFQKGLETVSAPGVNPVVALANMGVMYINFSANLWMMLLNLAVTSAIIPIFGLFIFALIALAMPLLLAWIGIMVTVGFTTAYYIPILPYMIFTFGTLAWMISVIEAMVAAPIVALGVTHPEGHDAFGKGEAAIMILMNIFLRPALMIIGYISAIALCYVGVWLLNAGFDHAIGYMQSSPSQDPNACKNSAWGMCKESWTGTYGSMEKVNPENSLESQGSGVNSAFKGTQYTDWAGIYAYFFSILIYTTMYLVIVQKSFTLISLLPDKVLRWIGGNPESTGQEAAQWGEEVKTKSGEAGKATQDAQGQMGNKLGGYGQKALGKISKPGGSGKAKMSGESTQSKPSGEG